MSPFFVLYPSIEGMTAVASQGGWSKIFGTLTYKLLFHIAKFLKVDKISAQKPANAPNVLKVNTMPKIRQPRHTSRIIPEVKEYASIIEKIRHYEKSGSIENVFNFFEPHINKATIKSWINDPNKITTAYKKDIFLSIGRNLPDLRFFEANNAYKFCLKELNIDVNSQDKPSDMEGRYYIYPKDEINTKYELAYISIIDRGIPIVMLRYNYNNTRRYGDGIIYKINDRYHISIISDHVTFVCIMKKYVNSKGIHDRIFEGHIMMADNTDHEYLNLNAVIIDVSYRNEEFNELIKSDSHLMWLHQESKGWK